MGLLLFVFLLFIPFSFLPDFLSKISPQPFKIETSNLVYRFTMTNCIMGLKMGLLLFVLPDLFIFSFSPDFSSKISPQPFTDRNFKFGIEVRYDKLYCEIANRHSPICSSLPFSFFSDFSSKISSQPFKIETSNLVYIFTTTSCIVESKMGLLLFVLLYICSFFCLSRIFVKDISTAV